MQTVIVIIIVFLAAAYLVRTIIAKPDKKDSCGCGCTSCPTADSCSDKEDQS
jgi:hypothetical protein